VAKQEIRRFPRLPVSKKIREKRAHIKRLQAKIERGFVPKGWDILKPRQKKLIRKVLRGESVVSACEKVGVDPNTYYRWLHCHKLFRAFYVKMASKLANEVDMRLDGLLPRAIRVVEETLDSPDPYHRYDAAHDLLKGKGKYKSKVESKSETTARVDIHEEHHIELDPNIAKILIGALAKKSFEAVPEEKVVTGKAKLLPADTDAS